MTRDVFDFRAYTRLKQLEYLLAHRPNRRPVLLDQNRMVRMLCQKLRTNSVITGRGPQVDSREIFVQMLVAHPPPMSDSFRLQRWYEYEQQFLAIKKGSYNRAHRLQRQLVVSLASMLGRQCSWLRA